MYEIVFKFKDSWTHGNWQERHCTMSSLKECIDMYGLEDPDVQYEIISMTKLDK